jgi:hypothetical protein
MPRVERRTCHVMWRTENELGVRFTSGDAGSAKEREFAEH